MLENLKFRFLLVLWRMVALLPDGFLLLLVSTLLKFVMLIKPRYRQITVVNLKIALPNRDDSFYDEVYHKSIKSFAQMIVDAINLPFRSKSWFRKKIILEDPNFYHSLKERYPDKGALLVSAHLGSFELTASAISLNWRPIYLIGRYHDSPILNRLMEFYRSTNGNYSIPRNGALKRMIKLIKSGQSVGMLFDQNVVRKDALFVPWFGKEAATTIALGALAVMTQCPIVMLVLKRQENGQYLFKNEELQYADVLSNNSLDQNQKMLEITRRAVVIMEQFILEDLGSWFWMHRRWKTRPYGEEEKIYQGI